MVAENTQVNESNETFLNRLRQRLNRRPLLHSVLGRRWSEGVCHRIGPNKRRNPVLEGGVKFIFKSFTQQLGPSTKLVGWR